MNRLEVFSKMNELRVYFNEEIKRQNFKSVLHEHGTIQILIDGYSFVFGKIGDMISQMRGDLELYPETETLLVLENEYKKLTNNAKPV